MRPPVVLRVVPNARHTYAYHPSTDVRAPSLRDARHAGFRMTHDEMVAARKHDSATAVTLASKDPAFHVSRVAPATPFWLNVQKELKEREHPVRKDDGRPHIDPREARANEVARGMTGILSSAAPIAKFLTRIAS